MSAINSNSSSKPQGFEPSRRFFVKAGAVALVTPVSTLQALAKPTLQEEKYTGPSSKDFYPTGKARTEWREWNQRASEMLNNPEFFKGLEMQELKNGSKVVKLSLKNIEAMKDKLGYDAKAPVKHVFARSISEDKSSYTLFFVRENDPNGPLVRVQAIPLTGKAEEKAFNIYEPDFSAATVAKKDGVVTLDYDIVNADDVPLRYEPHDFYKGGILIASPEVMKIQEKFSPKFKESSYKSFRDMPVMTIAVDGKPDSHVDLYAASDRNYDENKKPRKHALWDLDATFIRRPRKLETRKDGMMAYVQEPLLGKDGKKYSTNPDSTGARLVGGKIHDSGALVMQATGKPRDNRQVLEHPVSNPKDLASDKKIKAFYLEF